MVHSKSQEPRAKSQYLAYIKLARIDHWVKNGFVLLPILFSGNILDGNLLTQALLSFLAFSIIASSVYTINDIADLEFDRNHPIKKLSRPIAAGLVTKGNALRFALILGVVGFVLSIPITSLMVTALLFCYLIINILYSFYLKKIPIVDVFIVASGFVIRVLIGSFAINVVPSEWLVIMTFLLALFLGFAKRRDDFNLVGLESGHVRSVSGYNPKFIDSMIYVLCGVIIVAYIQYTISADTQNSASDSNFYLTTIFLIYGVFRYLQLVFVDGKSGNPTKLLLKDRHLLATVSLWVISVIYFIY